MSETVAPAIKCDHEWGPHLTVREPDFGVAYGSIATCKKCRCRLYENWCETRSSGGVPRILPPEDQTETITP